MPDGNGNPVPEGRKPLVGKAGGWKLTPVYGR